eukprot:gene7103-5109_t
MRQVPLGSTNLPVIPLALISIIGGFMSFSLVFFVSQAYSRLCAQYDQSMRIEGRIFNLAYLARSNLLYAEAHRLLRYLNATHVLGYTGLSLVYTDDNLFDIMNDKHQLLTFEELGRIREVGADGGGAAYREVIGWCVELLFDLNKAKPDKNETVAENPIEPLTLQTLVSEVLALRGCIGALYDYDDQPIPFVYVHILFFLTLFYLPLMTYAVALQFPIGSEFYVPDIIGSLLVFVNVVFVVGLREIGRNLISPYGDDSHDLSVIHYITFTMMASRRILAGHKRSLFVGSLYFTDADVINVMQSDAQSVAPIAIHHRGTTQSPEAVMQASMLLLRQLVHHVNLRVESPPLFTFAESSPVYCSVNLHYEAHQSESRVDPLSMWWRECAPAWYFWV